MPDSLDDLTHEIRGCFFDAQNEVHLGFPEEAYQRGMQKALAKKGIPFESKVTIHLKFGHRFVHKFRPDLIIDGRVVVELKAIEEDFARKHICQILSYLKVTGIRTGFLVNFGLDRVVDRRFIFDEQKHTVEENWDYVQGKIEGDERECMNVVRQSLIDVIRLHGHGYGGKVSERLTAAALHRRGLEFVSRPYAPASFEGHGLGKFPLNCFLINGRIVCVVGALKDEVTPYDVSRTWSYIKSLGVRCGVVANFANDALELRGVAVDANARRA